MYRKLIIGNRNFRGGEYKMKFNEFLIMILVLLVARK